jgi:hypothetical protein
MSKFSVAALYVDPRGPYPSLPGVDAWAPPRDARIYDGPLPVVAHPPCGGWSSLRHLYQGDDTDCAVRAVEQVRAFGGVLEHPAHSRLWGALDLPDVGLSDRWGFTYEVTQVSWGHVARKRTWLYACGVDYALLSRTRRVGGTPTHWVSGGGTGRGATPPGIKVCSAQQRRRSPPAFAEWLVMLARSTRCSP